MEGLFYEECLFLHHLQHYWGTTRPIKTQLCLCVHRQVCCDKMSSIAVKSYTINGNSRFDQLATAFHLYPSLKVWNHQSLTSLLMDTDDDVFNWIKLGVTETNKLFIPPPLANIGCLFFWCVCCVCSRVIEALHFPLMRLIRYPSEYMSCCQNLEWVSYFSWIVNYITHSIRCFAHEMPI